MCDIRMMCVMLLLFVPLIIFVIFFCLFHFLHSSVFRLKSVCVSLNVCMHIFFPNNISLFGVGKCVYRECSRTKTLGIFYDVTVFFLNGLNNCMYVNQCHNVMGMGLFFSSRFKRTHLFMHKPVSRTVFFLSLRIGFTSCC